MAELVGYRCPQCGRRYKELRGPLMSDMGTDWAARRERVHMFMRGTRDRLRGIERRVMPETEENWFPTYEISCRRCGLPMDQYTLAMVD